MFLGDIFKQTEITIPKKETCNDWINKFVIQINLEREQNLQKKLPFIAIRQKLVAIAKNEEALRDFFSDCMRYKSHKGSFSKCFFGGTKTVDKSA